MYLDRVVKVSAIVSEIELGFWVLLAYGHGKEHTKYEYIGVLHGINYD